MHVRIGPYWRISEGPQFDAYEHLGRRADLSKLRPDFWGALDGLAQQALELGVTLEVDLIDGWVMKPANVTLSPWFYTNNAQGEGHVGCGELQGPLDSRHEAWTRYAVTRLGRYSNVIWQLGNENGVCRPPVSRMWEADMVWVIRDEEHRHSYMAHMIGTNSELDDLETLGGVDYIMSHVSEAIPARHGKPTGVNEYPDITPKQYEIELERAKALGTRFDLWLGDSTPAQLEEYLKVVASHTGH